MSHARRSSHSGLDRSCRAATKRPAPNPEPQVRRSSPKGHPVANSRTIFGLALCRLPGCDGSCSACSRFISDGCRIEVKRRTPAWPPGEPAHRTLQHRRGLLSVTTQKALTGGGHRIDRLPIAIMAEVHTGRDRQHFGQTDLISRTGSYKLLQCCESSSEERSAGNPHSGAIDAAFHSPDRAAANPRRFFVGQAPEAPIKIRASR